MAEAAGHLRAESTRAATPRSCCAGCRRAHRSGSSPTRPAAACLRFPARVSWPRSTALAIPSTGTGQVSPGRAERTLLRRSVGRRGQARALGPDGLGTIDTRTWKTHHIASGVGGAVATPFGIAAWGDPSGGLTVYRPDGRMRLRVRVEVSSAQAVGAYLYVNLGEIDSQYSVDLRTCKVVGPLRPNVVLWIPRPDLVANP